VVVVVVVVLIVVVGATITDCALSDICLHARLSLNSKKKKRKTKNETNSSYFLF